MLNAETVTVSEPSTDSDGNPWRIFIPLLFGTFVAIEAAAFQSPALAPISRHFSVPVSSVALVLLIYYLGAAIFAPVMGRLSDQIGRKRTIMLGLLMFSIAEFSAAVSPNFAFFLIARFVQGLGVACMLPMVVAYIGYLFPAERRGLPLGVLAFAMSAGATSGALIGGVLIDLYGWPSIYWVSGVLALAGLALISMVVPESEPVLEKRGFDLQGACLLLVGAGSLLAIPTLVGNFGVASPLTVGALFAGFSGCVLLWRTSGRSPWPVVEVNLLRQRAFLFPALIAFLHALCYGGAVFSLAFVVADRPGGSASQVGFVNMFVYGFSALMAPFAGRLVDRVGARRVLIFALVIMLVALVCYSRINAATPLWAIVIVASVFGLVAGAKTPAVMQIALATIPKDRMGSGSGLLTMLRDLGSPAGSSFSLAIYGATMGTALQIAVQARAQDVGLGNAWQGSLAAAVNARGRQIDGGLYDALQMKGLDFAALYEPALVDAIAKAMPQVGTALAGVITLALILAWCLPRSAQR